MIAQKVPRKSIAEGVLLFVSGTLLVFFLAHMFPKLATLQPSL